MRNLRKFMAMALAVVMAMALTAPAFADTQEYLSLYYGQVILDDNGKVTGFDTVGGYCPDNWGIDYGDSNLIQTGLVYGNSTDVDIYGPRADEFSPALTAPAPGLVLTKWALLWDRSVKNGSYDGMREEVYDMVRGSASLSDFYDKLVDTANNGIVALVVDAGDTAVLSDQLPAGMTTREKMFMLPVWEPTSDAGSDAEFAYTYDVFQIFTGDYAEADGKILSNVKWGQNGIGTAGDRVSADILAELEALIDPDGQAAVNTGSTNRDRLEVILKYANLDGTALATGKTLDEVNTMDLANGYYLVRTNADSVGANGAFDIYTVQVVDNHLNLNPKFSRVPEIEKTIIGTDGNAGHNGDSALNSDTGASGNLTMFQIKTRLPDNMHDYKEYFFKITDTVSGGLVVPGGYINNGWIQSVTINGVDIKDQMYVGKPSQNTIVFGFQNVLALDLSKGSGIDSEAVENHSWFDDAEIVITYGLKMAFTEAMPGVPGTNDVQLEYSNDPNNSGDGTKKNDPTKEPETTDPTGNTVKGENATAKSYVTGLTVEAFTKTGMKPLEGAEFELTGNGICYVLEISSTFEKADDGNYYKLKGDAGYTIVPPADDTRDQYDLDAGMFKKTETVNRWPMTSDSVGGVHATIDENGQLSFFGLASGEYTLKNTKIPAGYNLADDIKFTISFDADEDVLFSSNNTQVVERTPEWFYVTILVDNGSLLPETGGMGTTILTVGGICLIAAAGAVLVLKRRKSGDVE